MLCHAAFETLSRRENEADVTPCETCFSAPFRAITEMDLSLPGLPNCLRSGVMDIDRGMMEVASHFRGSV